MLKAQNRTYKAVPSIPLTDPGDERAMTVREHMKEFTVKVTAITTVTVDAATEDEAIDKACEIAWEFDADEMNGEILEG